MDDRLWRQALHQPGLGLAGAMRAFFDNYAWDVEQRGHSRKPQRPLKRRSGFDLLLGSHRLLSNKTWLHVDGNQDRVSSVDERHGLRT